MSTKTKDQIGIEQTTLIDAPLEQVFAYYADPRNLPEIWPSLLEVKDVETDENGNPVSFGWVFKMAGMRFSGQSEVSEFEPNRRYVTESRGGIDSTFVTAFEERGGHTEVHEVVSYRVPIPLVGRVAERFLLKMNENELALMHANLKARLESES